MGIIFFEKKIYVALITEIRCRQTIENGRKTVGKLIAWKGSRHDAGQGVGAEPRPLARMMPGARNVKNVAVSESRRAKPKKKYIFAPPTN